MDNMDNNIVGALLAGLIGAGAGIIGVLLGTGLQIYADHLRARRSREDVISNELAVAVQKLSTSLASCLHSMAWLTWLAATREDRIDKTFIATYDEEQHRALSEVMGYLTIIAALDLEMYRKLKPHADSIALMDANIATACLSMDLDRPAAIAKLSAYNGNEVYNLLESFPITVGDIIGRGFRQL